MVMKEASAKYLNEETEKRETVNRPSGANSRIESCTEWKRRFKAAWRAQDS